ncbi:MAG TPA: hypothetical protein VK689_12025 [Armatimonadota bacterium]|nr:hypothetical protein [Armatimonadota bacterium]
MSSFPRYLDMPQTHASAERPARKDEPQVCCVIPTGKLPSQVRVGADWKETRTTWTFVMVMGGSGRARGVVRTPGEAKAESAEV